MTNETRFKVYNGLPGVSPIRSGKVRDVFDLGDKLIIVASDRISAYDSILPTPIPGKGILLNTISTAWFDLFNAIPNHFITSDINLFPDPFDGYRDRLEGRSMLVHKAERIDIECIVRGYITGSGWKEYQNNGSVCGIKLPEDLKLSDKLSEPIFTPSTKSEEGHDENITIEEAASLAGKETIEKIKDTSIELYKRASEYASSKGILIADTKFEFGLINGELSLIDEVLTPDSSRFWLKEEYSPGKPQRSLDKQFVRDYLDEISWDRVPPAPELPQDIVNKTAQRYRMAAELLFSDLNIGRYFE